jgi:hypothetical protein
MATGDHVEVTTVRTGAWEQAASARSCRYNDLFYRQHACQQSCDEQQFAAESRLCRVLSPFDHRARNLRHSSADHVPRSSCRIQYTVPMTFFILSGLVNVRVGARGAIWPRPQATAGNARGNPRGPPDSRRLSPGRSSRPLRRSRFNKRECMPKVRSLSGRALGRCELLDSFIQPALLGKQTRMYGTYAVRTTFCSTGHCHVSRHDRTWSYRCYS